jgi:hypothetical protein
MFGRPILGVGLHVARSLGVPSLDLTPQALPRRRMSGSSAIDPAQVRTEATVIGNFPTGGLDLARRTDWWFGLSSYAS